MTVISLRVNGEQVRADAEPGTPLLTVLRNRLGLKAAKFGCGQSLCGACTVWVAGRPTYSCDFPVEVVGDSEIRTLESLGTESAASAAAGLPRRAGRAVRVLPARDHHAGSRLSPGPSCAQPSRRGGGAGPESVPVRQSPADHRCRAASRHKQGIP